MSTSRARKDIEHPRNKKEAEVKIGKFFVFLSDDYNDGSYSF
jgi:hypothetical protein